MMSIHESTLPSGNGDSGEPDAQVEVLEPEAVDVDSLGELAALQGVVKFPVRIKCATLSWNTLAQGLDETESVA
jgi:nitrogen fixation NifU-like protein